MLKDFFFKYGNFDLFTHIIKFMNRRMRTVHIMALAVHMQFHILGHSIT